MNNAVSSARIIRRLTVVVAALAIVPLLAACGADAPVADEPASFVNAAVTIYATEFFTREVGGDRVRVTALLSPGTDAHDFEPTPRHIRAIAESDIVVFNHPAFETWIVAAIESSRDEIRFIQLADLPGDIEFIDDHDHGHADGESLAELVDHVIHEFKDGEIDAATALDEIVEAIRDHGDKDPEFADEVLSVLAAFEAGGLTAEQALDALHDVAVEHLEEGHDGHAHEHEHGEGAVDPHVWLNPIEALKMVNRVRDVLAEIDPQGASYYTANAAALAARLESLDDRFEVGLASCEHSIFVASHLAYGHLAERYGLEQIGLTGLSDEAETSPRRVTEVVERIRELGLDVILVEPLSNQALAETVARETGAQLLPLHPLESLTPAEHGAGDDYFVIMEKNLASLRAALHCSG